MQTPGSVQRVPEATWAPPIPPRDPQLRSGGSGGVREATGLPRPGAGPPSACIRLRALVLLHQQAGDVLPRSLSGPTESDEGAPRGGGPEPGLSLRGGLATLPCRVCDTVVSRDSDFIRGRRGHGAVQPGGCIATAGAGALGHGCRDAGGSGAAVAGDGGPKGLPLPAPTPRRGSPGDLCLCLGWGTEGASGQDSHQ